MYVYIFLPLRVCVCVCVESDARSSICPTIHKDVYRYLNTYINMAIFFQTVVNK